MGRPKKVVERKPHPRPPKGRPIVKGEVRNPFGRNQFSNGAARLKSLTSAEIRRLGELVLSSNVEGLMAIAKEPDASALTVAFAAILARAIKDADINQLNQFLDRVHGTMQQKHRFSGEGPSPFGVSAPPAQVMVVVPSNGREVAVEPPKEVKQIEGETV